MLDLDEPSAGEDLVFIAAPARAARVVEGCVSLTLPLFACRRNSFLADPNVCSMEAELRIQAWGAGMIRVTVAFGGGATDAPGGLDSSPMIERDPALTQEGLTVAAGTSIGEYIVSDTSGRVVFRTLPPQAPSHPWSNLEPDPEPVFDAVVYPSKGVEVPFMAHDAFFPAHRESIGLGCVVRSGQPRLSLFSLHARPGERFLGTGERFSRFGLAGSTIDLENTDALGVSSRRAYKNVPFYVSSEGYGLFIHTSNRARLSFADVSSRAVQGAIESARADLFFIGGGSPAAIVAEYRRLTGVPPLPPLWSYGTWMARMSYFSAKEAMGVADRLREEGFPCDVIHLDTGWFKSDWRCEWEFSPERFPDPEGFFREMRQKGFRVTLWQLPLVTEGTSLYALARERKYVAPGDLPLESKFDDARGCTIDFTNPEAVEWYKGLLRRLLKMG
ncbi:MAG TPA: TIM-barrel domain-containing protein, partial [Spirochaetia bacterium]|nr:TIM-barrel domain-containing protein [Spirochaetia bacterium]